MLNFAQGSLNPTLTNYAKQLRQDRMSKLADFIAPPVVVPTSSFQYKLYSDLNAFQAIDDTSLPPNGEPKQIDFGVYGTTGNCAAQALEARLTKPELDAIRLGAADPLQIQQSKIATVLDTAMLSHEAYVYGKLAALTSSGSIQFSDPSVDPTTEVDRFIVTLAGQMGRLPNRAVCDLTSFQLWRDNPNTIKRHAYGVSQEGVTAGTLVGYTINPQLQLKVGVLSKNLAKPNAGEKRKNQFLGAGRLYLFFANDAPDTADASAFKTFMTGSSNIEGVISYTAANTLYEGHIVYWSRLTVQTSPYSIIALDIT